MADIATRVRATARIQVTVELTAGVWGQDCPMDQVYRQAKEDALSKIHKEIPNARIVGTPRVTAVLVEEAT